MSEEEKKIIDRINRSYDDNTQYVEASAEDWNCITHLIKKQQKEIAELKEQNIQLTKYLNDSYYVSADKIREKIKELKNIIEFEKPTYEDCLKYTIDILEELLGE